MFGQMRSSGHREEPKPCPCGGSCECHKPVKGESWEVWLIGILGLSILVLFPILIPLMTRAEKLVIMTPETTITPYPISMSMGKTAILTTNQV